MLGAYFNAIWLIVSAFLAAWGVLYVWRPQIPLGERYYRWIPRGSLGDVVGRAVAAIGLIGLGLFFLLATFGVLKP